MFTVAIVEKESLFGAALQRALANDERFVVVAEVERVDALSVVRPEPDVIIIDGERVSTGLEFAIGHCRQLLPHGRICVLGERVRGETGRRAMAAGADAFVPTDVAPGELARAIVIVRGGGTYVDPRTAAGAPFRASGARARHELSGRETQIVRLIAQGASNRTIGATLQLSEKTVKNHVSRILAKLEVTARSQAAAYAATTGLV